MPPTITLETPSLVALSAPGETRWGFHQFPALSRLPDGNLLCMFADAADASETHGCPAPDFVSTDEGRSWHPAPDGITPVRPHFSISEVFDGELLVMPACAYLDVEIESVSMPAPVAEADIYGIVYSYRVEDFPPRVRDYFGRIPAKRWRPASGAWEDDVVDYDTAGLLPWRRKDSRLLPRTYFEHAVLKRGKELLIADYRAQYVLADGTIPARNTTSLLVSADNGHTFRRRATIAADRANRDIMAEPHLAATAGGDLVCIIRRTDQNQKPMWITWSTDDGHTWEAGHSLFDFGVFPCLQLLGNGCLVLSYGRPGVHLAVSTAGDGRQWDAHQQILPGDPAAVHLHTCGYTSMLPLNDDTLLLAYSDFDYPHPTDATCKAILTRRIRVKR